MTDTPAAVRPKGLYCPNCRGLRLVVETTRRVCPGKVVRYRRCSACGAKVITEEKVAAERKPRTPAEPK